MTPEEIKEARHELGLTLTELGHMLGYSGNGVKVQMNKMESRGQDGEPIRNCPPCHARLIQAYLDGYRPDDWPVDD